jgi:WD40 repeat protein
MATKLVALLKHGSIGRLIAGTAGTLAVLSTFAGCDQKFGIDPLPTDQVGVGGAVTGAGGSGGVTPAVETGTGGTTAPTTAVGGSGGQPTAVEPIPAGCSPISTTPGVVDPCGHAFGIAYSPDGRFLAIGSDSANPSVRVWRLADGMPLPDLPGQTLETTYGVAFSSDSKVLAAAGYTGNGDSNYDVPWVRLWDMGTGSLIRTLRPNTGWYADSVAFSNDGGLILTGGFNGDVELWRVADGTKTLTIPVPSTAHNVHFSPDNTKIIIATFDGKARVYDVASGTLLLGPLDIASEMADAAMSPDGTQIATTWQSGNENNSVRIYDGTTGALVQSLAGHSAYISRVVWIDQNRIVSGDWSGQVILWQRGANGAFALAKSWSTGGQCLGIGVSPDKTTIVTGGSAGGSDGFVFLSL